MALARDGRRIGLLITLRADPRSIHFRKSGSELSSTIVGRLIGPKPPFKPKRIWAIRTRLQHEGRIRDLTLFNTAIDSKLRGCDLVRLRVADVRLGDGVHLRTTIVQYQTGRSVPFELTEPTREMLTAWLALRGPRASDWLFPSRSRAGEHMTTRQYGRLVDQRVALIGLDPLHQMPGLNSLAPVKQGTEMVEETS